MSYEFPATVQINLPNEAGVVSWHDIGTAQDKAGLPDLLQEAIRQSLETDPECGEIRVVYSDESIDYGVGVARLYARVADDLFADIPQQSCMDPHYDFRRPCRCSRIDSILCKYRAINSTLRPMTERERNWCIERIRREGDGRYQIEQLKAMTDHELAVEVENAAYNFRLDQLFSGAEHRNSGRY
jgi:hypothetical protein